MKTLITQSLLNEIPDLYETEGTLDPLCRVKLFTPHANWTWYIIEISKEDKDYCFGYVVGLESELGYFSLLEIKSLRGPLGLAVERDEYFNPTPFSKVKELENAIR